MLHNDNAFVSIRLHLETLILSYSVKFYIWYILHILITKHKSQAFTLYKTYAI